MIPGCAPPPIFCGEGAGAGGAASGPGDAGSGGRMGAAGSKGNGPDSGAAETTGNGNCNSCKVLGSSSGDSAGGRAAWDREAARGAASASAADRAVSSRPRAPTCATAPGASEGLTPPGSAGVTANPWNTYLGRNWSPDYAERIVMDPDETHAWLLTRFGSFREFGSLAAGSGSRLYQTVTPSDEYRKRYRHQLPCPLAGTQIPSRLSGGAPHTWRAPAESPPGSRALAKAPRLPLRMLHGDRPDLRDGPRCTGPPPLAGLGYDPRPEPRTLRSACATSGRAGA
jgi:hypothetical protein